MRKVTDIEGARMHREMAMAAGPYASTQASPLSPYELGFVEALLHRDGVKWGDATAGQFEAALREMRAFVRTERGELTPD